MNRLTSLLLALAACATDPMTDIDEPVDDLGDGKADGLDDARHYLLTNEAPVSSGIRTLRRAGGGQLRCPSGEVAESCTLEDSRDLTTTPGLSSTAWELLDEAEDHAILLRGSMRRAADGRIYLRASAAIRAITSVLPTTPCYRMRPLSTPAICNGDPLCVNQRLELLDQDVVRDAGLIYFDEVDPTPDFWGQPTPAVQAAVDDALRLAAMRPVYVCGGFDSPSNGAFWAQQLFAPR